MKWLFPEQKRVIAGKRWLSISCRTLHLLGISGLAGAYLYQLPESAWLPYLWMAVISGTCMALMEIYTDGIWLFQLRGTAVALKLLLLSSVLWWFDQPNSMIYFLVIIISGFVSHAPGRVRYYSIWHGRVLTEPLQLAPGEIKDCGE